MQNFDNHRDLTIRELAAMLNLSTATVSRALNHDDGVRTQTKKRVFDLAEKLGYRMNEHAKNLRNGRSQTIGCIVPRLDHYLMSTVIAGLESAARREEYCLVVMQSYGSVETEAFCANFLFNKRVDGLMVQSSEERGDLERFRHFIQKNIPVVLLGRAGNDQGFVNLSVDHRQAGYEMTRHLLARGCRQIVHITSDHPAQACLDRCEGYKQALAEAGIPVREQYIIKGGPGLEDGMAAAETICQWKQRPDAIIAASDHCAAGCILRLKARGIRIPDEIAVAGFDDDPVASVTEPDITTMSYPGYQIGEAAVNQLMDHIQEDVAGKMIDIIVLRSRIVIRGSTVID